MNLLKVKNQKANNNKNTHFYVFNANTLNHNILLFRIKYNPNCLLSTNKAPKELQTCKNK